ncbi:MAG TPA: hypothetical protein VGK72_11470 [Chthoniobacterales bacterium]
MKGAIVVLLSLTLSAFGQELQKGDSMLVRPTSFVALPTIYSAPAVMALADQRPFSFPGAFSWVAATPADFLPEFTAEQPARRSWTAKELPNERGGLVDLVPAPVYVSGEVSLFFGKSIDGKVDREIKGGYILGEIISGNTHINVGASYERASGDFPRLNR